MVKADLTRDYYADLELQPGATDVEIKKQFKKLGMFILALLL
jgi:curved DNA-binding protein CbpA